MGRTYRLQCDVRLEWFCRVAEDFQMIRGIVTNRRATVNLTLHLPGQPNLTIEFEIDTAFRGALAMPPDAVAALKLPFLMETRTLPASGILFKRTYIVQTYSGTTRHLP